MAIRRKQQPVIIKNDNPYLVGDLEMKEAKELIRARKANVFFKEDPTLNGEWWAEKLSILINFLIKVRKRNLIMLGECPAHNIHYRGIIITTSGDIVVIDISRADGWRKEVAILEEDEPEIIQE